MLKITIPTLKEVKAFLENRLTELKMGLMYGNLHSLYIYKDNYLLNIEVFPFISSSFSKDQERGMYIVLTGFVNIFIGRTRKSEVELRSQKSEVGIRNSEVGSRKSEVGSRIFSLNFVMSTVKAMSRSTTFQ